MAVGMAVDGADRLVEGGYPVDLAGDAFGQQTVDLGGRQSMWTPARR